VVNLRQIAKPILVNAVREKLAINAIVAIGQRYKSAENAKLD
jgi:hypothetical protein